ncbi:MAG: amidoligase family protein [Wenzhouxiangella sp.]|jgi:hypothetical protein|nr:amidoligase family protein [Wenzhouxiangella sp.]
MPSFATPPWTRTGDGQVRRVGVEMEMSGIEPAAIAEAVTATVGGRIERESAFYTRVKDSDLGDFGIELDADLLSNRQYQERLAELGIEIGEGETRDNLERMLSRIAGLVVPLELVGPPVPWSALPTLDIIRARLNEAGALGTASSALYAFGLQLNVEAASLSSDHLLAMLRAFVLKYEWLLGESQVDLSRRISPYIQPYPEEYVVHLLQRDYAPDLSTLIDDFLTFTPTRNRPMDMLPLLAHIDEDRVMAAPVEHDLIKPRPAFHYRLPNCLIDDPEWSLAEAWNDWVEVERLAADPEALERQRRDRLGRAGSLRGWLARLKQRFLP